MSLFRHSTVGLGVSLDRLACAAITNDMDQWRTHSAPLPKATTNDTIWSERVAHALDSLMAKCADSQARIRVVLASQCLREWVMNVPEGVQSLSELRTLATARFAQLYGHAPDAWIVTADWKARGPMLCTAAPRALIETLQRELARRGLGICISTTLCSALADIPTLPDEAWLCIRTPGFNALLMIRRRTLQLLRTLRTGDLTQDQQLTNLIAEVKRACLRGDFTPPSRIHIYDFSQDQCRQATIDGVEIVPVSSRVLQRMASARKDEESTVAACLGAAL